MTLIESLAASSLFKSLSAEQLEQVAQLARERVFRTGEYLFYEDTDAGEIFLVVMGQVLLTMQVVQPSRHTTREVNVVTSGPEKLLGFWALLPPYKYRLSAKAVVDAGCLVIDTGALMALMANDMRFEGEIRRGLIELLIQRHDQMAEVLAYERAMHL